MTIAAPLFTTSLHQKLTSKALKAQPRFAKLINIYLLGLKTPRILGMRGVFCYNPQTAL